MGGLTADGTADREDLLAAAVVKAVRDSGAHAGSIFLRSRDRGSIVLAATCGMPPSLLGGWHLVPVGSPIPVAAAYASGRTVHLAHAGENVRRYPQLAMALPYAFGSCTVPVGVEGEAFGALSVVWAAPPGSKGLPRARRRQVRTTANRLGARLAALGARTGTPVECDPQTVPVETPVPSPPAVRLGLFHWELDTGTLTADDEFCAVFGLDPRAFDGRPDTLAGRLHPGDVAAFRAAPGAAAAGRGTVTRHLRVHGAEGGLDEGDGYRSVELWGRVPDAGEGHERNRMVGAVVDAGAGSACAAAVERLHDGVFSLAPDGRVTYASGQAEEMLGVRREALVGRRLWDVLPWLSDPDFEDRYRSVMISQAPASFLVRSPPDRWLVLSLHPDAAGVTGTVATASRPPDAGSPDAGPPDVAPAEIGPAQAEPPPPAGPARLGVVSHVLQLGSALTEAVTAREVCDAVAHQLLPAFGGQQLAIYVVRRGTMQRIFRAGRHESFLDWLEGMRLHARLPGTEALTSGVPLFIESRQALAQGYPDAPAGEARAWAYLPLIASGRPVGTCALGYDEPHTFTTKDRGVLTALAGLIGQALERARLYDSESALARGLQQALLPHRLPALPGLGATARYLPGTSEMDIGGDWYDVIPTRTGVSLVVGDVEGHSIAAAATMAHCAAP